MDKYCALYSRVSDEIQVQRGESIPRQKQMLVDEAKRMGFARWVHYSDEGISGKNSNRPDFQKMVGEIKSGRVSYVLAYDLSRISRDELDTFKFTDLLEETGTSFKSLCANYDMSTPEGKMMMGISTVTNAFFRRDLVRKVKDAMFKMHKDGRFTGGQPAFGYDVKDKKLVINLKEAKVVHKIFDMFEQTHSFRSVTIYLNKYGYVTKKGKLWPAQKVRQIITNPMYYGYQTFGKRIGANKSKVQPRDKWLITKGNFEPIITKEQWDRCQAIIAARNFKTPAKGQYVSILNGILYCGCCGWRMYGSFHKKGRLLYYRCSSKSHRGMCSESLNFKGEEIEEAVINEVKTKVLMHFSKEEFNSAMPEDDQPSELEQITTSLKELQGKEARILDLMVEGKISKDILHKKLEPIKEQINNLEQRKAALHVVNNVEARQARLKIYEKIEALNGDVLGYPRAQLKEILKEVIHKITITKDEITVEMWEV